MDSRILAVACVTVMLFVFTEGRWRNLKMLRKHRMHHSTMRAWAPALLISGDEDEYPVGLSENDGPSLRYHRQYPPASLENEADDDDNNREPLTDEPEDYRQSRSADEEVVEMRRVPRHRLLHHRKHVQQHRQHDRHHKSLDHGNADPLELVKQYNQDYDSTAVEDILRSRARGKRHNRRRSWTEKDRKSFNSSRPKPTQLENEKLYEVEVREAQNSSLCNYTVIPIPDPGGRIPYDLEHVKCNHVGSKCQDTGTYCCIQTFRNIEVRYEDGRRETLKLYSGCVCSLQIYGTLEPYTPEIEIDE